jgi:hypothetical protein
VGGGSMPTLYSMKKGLKTKVIKFAEKLKYVEICDRLKEK